LPPSPTFGTKVGLGEPRPFGAGDLRFFIGYQKCISSFAQNP